LESLARQRMEENGEDIEGEERGEETGEDAG